MVDNDRFLVPMIFFAHLAFMVVHVKDFGPNAQPFRPIIEIIRGSGCNHIRQLINTVFANAHTKTKRANYFRIGSCWLLDQWLSAENIVTALSYINFNIPPARFATENHMFYDCILLQREQRLSAVWASIPCKDSIFSFHIWYSSSHRSFTTFSHFKHL